MKGYVISGIQQMGIGVLNLKEAWDKTMTYIQTNNLEFTETGPMIETYLTDPMETPNPADWVTEIFIAVK